MACTYLPVGAHIFLFPDGLLLVVEGDLALCRTQYLVLTPILYADKVSE